MFGHDADRTGAVAVAPLASDGPDARRATDGLDCLRATDGPDGRDATDSDRSRRAEAVTVGTLVLSLDAELAWGFHDVDPPAERIADARRGWRRLVALFDRYEAPATWAVVGHLLLDDCEEPHRDHPAGARPCDAAPGSDGARSLSSDRAWYGRDLVEAVREAGADHEIAGHGFTHVHFDHERMTRPFARREVERTRDAAAAVGCDLDSFVFPVNEVGYRDLLAGADFGCYRGRAPTADRTAADRRVRKAAGALLDRGHAPLVRPRVDEYGLVNVPASMYLFDGLGPVTGAAAALHDDPVANRAERGVDAAAEDGGVCHLWFHPHNLTDPADYARIRRVLKRAADHRDAGDLEIATMGTVADRTRRAES
ncbi:polysaccharide deacetylase family protein [Halosimplex salinum]|uniref:polysaccharide deacetylase family protein n=1 Tax=Halosimplex salinum TaxID=1710538 RepID=UPI0019D26C92|nr:polysaccharide deacetylase family protein [Halosimplex salinum]